MSHVRRTPSVTISVVVGASEPFRKQKMTIKVNPVSIVSFSPALYDSRIFSKLLDKDFPK